MTFIKKLLIAAFVVGAFSAFVVSTGNWEAGVVAPARAIFGEVSAKHIDNAGRKASEVADKAAELDLDFSSGFVGEDGSILNLDVVKDTLAGVPNTSNTRIPKYDRQLFGTPWADTDKNGCSTRDDMLARDLKKVKKDGKCTVISGVLDDPYTGDTINFVRGAKTSSAVQIDHMYSLSAAWKSGAHAWSDQERLIFANDPVNLVASDGPENQRKSDKTPADWLPPNFDYQCTFVSQYVFVADKYDLQLENRDKKAISKALESC